MWKQSWGWLALRRKKKKTLDINELEPNASQEKCHVCKKKFGGQYADDKKNYCKVRDYCYFTRKLRGTVHSICNLRYNLSKEIPLAFNWQWIKTWLSFSCNSPSKRVWRRIVA